MRASVSSAAIAIVFVTASCNETNEQKGDDKKAAAPAPASVASDATTTGATAAGVSGDAFYTGYDGQTDYSLLLPSFATYSMIDQSVARIEEVKVQLPEATVNELIASAKQQYPSIDETRVKRMFSREQTTFKVTPLKAGVATINKAGRAGRDSSNWKSGASITLVVNAYTPELYEAGKRRYQTVGSGGNLKACRECHETGQEGAPPHELGRIMEISDADAMTWITTGKLAGRTAKIQHTWEFATSEEEEGIVPYLRGKQTHDVEQLAKLYFEEFLVKTNGFAPPEGGPNGEAGRASGSGGAP